MNRPPITAKRVLIALTVLLLILSQLPQGAATTISYIPRSFVALISKPAVLLTRMSTTLRPTRDDTAEALSVDELVEKYPDIQNLVNKYADALAYKDNLEQQIIELRNISESLTQIDALLNIEDIRLAGAGVIGFNGDLENPILTIGIGSDSGVRDGLAVVWGASLVGKVVSTSAKSADVQLITAADTKLQVRIARYTSDGPTTPLPAYIQLDDDGRSFYTEEFSVDAPVAVGDMVHLADDSWQFRARGFIVGVVSEVGKSDRPLLNSRVVIRPMLSLASLPRVVVLVPRD